MTSRFSLDTLQRRLARLSRATQSLEVQVGLFDPRAAEIGARHEYGSRTVPQRSFLRKTLNENADLWVRELGTSLQKTGVLDPEGVTQALEHAGALAARDVQATLMNGKADGPALSPATVAAKRAKGYPQPETKLVAEGRLAAKISYQVVRS